MSIKTILITSAGGLTGTYLIKLLKQTTNYRVVGIDMQKLVPMMDQLDKFYEVPASNNENFLTELLKIVKLENIDLLIPVSSYDVKIFSRQEIKSQLSGIKYMVIESRMNSILHNKDSSYKYLSSLGLDVPIIYNSDRISFPLMIKPVDGSGSKNTIKLEEQKDLTYYKEKYNDMVLVEYLPGEEYTVDCLFDMSFKCNGFNIRRRTKVNGGGAVVTTNDYRYYEKVKQTISILEGTNQITGPINFQFKVRDNGTICIFDFNTRLASGGLPVTVKSGFNIPLRIIQLLNGENVEPWEIDRSLEGLTMIRYYEETFIKE